MLCYCARSAVSTSLIADIADDVAAACNSQFVVSTQGQKAGIAADPVRHCKTCK